MTAQLLEMKAIDKSFSEVKVLQQAQFSLESGEVHALMGENGAGKSTLMKILNGIYAKDGGTVTVKGAEQALSTPSAAQQLGITMIHQELKKEFSPEFINRIDDIIIFNPLTQIELRQICRLLVGMWQVSGAHGRAR